MSKYKWWKWREKKEHEYIISWGANDFIGNTVSISNAVEALDYSIHRETAPIYTMGQMRPTDFVPIRTQPVQVNHEAPEGEPLIYRNGQQMQRADEFQETLRGRTANYVVLDEVWENEFPSPDIVTRVRVRPTREEIRTRIRESFQDSVNSYTGQLINEELVRNIAMDVNNTIMEFLERDDIRTGMAFSPPENEYLEDWTQAVIETSVSYYDSDGYESTRYPIQ